MDIQVPPNVMKIIRRLKRFGYQSFLVGGCLRDSVLDLNPKDWDIATNATPDEIKKVFDNCRIVGKRFPIAHIYFRGEYIEVSTYRDEDGEYGVLVDDAYRRDFTVNALYYEPDTKMLIDKFDGMGDLDKKIVKVIGDPRKRFEEDPVRMVRAARLNIKCGLYVTSTLKHDIVACSHLLSNENSSRLYLEFTKTLDPKYSDQMGSLDMLMDFHLLEMFFPADMLGEFEPFEGEVNIPHILKLCTWEYYCNLVRECVSDFNLHPIPASQKAAKLLGMQLREHMNVDVKTTRELKQLLVDSYRSQCI